MDLTTIDSLESEVNVQAVEVLLARPMPDLIAALGNYFLSIEQNRGRVARQSRYENFPTNPVPLEPDGSNPVPMQLNRLDTDAKVQWYGGYTAITEEVLLLNQHRVLEETLDLLAQSMKETDDQLMREYLVNASAFINAVHGNNGDNPTNAVRADFDDVYSVLRGANAQPLISGIGGEDKFGTGPVRRAYIGKTDTGMIGELDRVEGFLNVIEYPKQDTMHAEYCAIGNFRIFLSSDWPVTSNASAKGNDVHNIITQGMEAACQIELDGYSVQYRYTPPRIAGGPLWRYGTSGYTFTQANDITNTTWMQNLRCTKLDV